MNKPLVSIIIPTYNRAHLIGETLDSILAQTYNNWECIIVDDGSTDHTAELIESYINRDSRFKYHMRPDDRPKGANACRNYGFELSEGTLVNWFDSDDLMMPNKLELNYLAFKNNPRLEMCFSEAKSIDMISGEIRHLSKVDTTNIFKDYVLKNILLSCIVPLWKKDFLKKTNLFNELTLRGQEYEFYSEIFYDKLTVFEVIKIPLIIIRIHSNSITSSFNNFDTKRLKSYTDVTNNILRKVCNLQDNLFYLEYSKILYQNVFTNIRAKHYLPAYKQSKLILKLARSNCFYFLNNHAVIVMMILFQGKAYDRFKKLIK